MQPEFVIHHAPSYKENEFERHTEVVSRKPYKVFDRHRVLLDAKCKLIGELVHIDHFYIMAATCGRHPVIGIFLNRVVAVCTGIQKRMCENEKISLLRNIEIPGKIFSSERANCIDIRRLLVN